jgi:3-phytase
MKKQRQLQNRANTNARIDVGINVGTPWRSMFGMIAGAALLSGCYAAGSAPQPSAADTASIPSAIATAATTSSTLQWQPHVVTGLAAPGVEVTGDVNLTIAASPYRLVSSNQGLQVFRAGVLVAQFAGEFSRLKAQMLVPALAGDDMVVMAIEQQQNKIWLWRFNSSTAAAPFSADKAQQWPVQSRVLDDICLYQSPTHAQLSLFLIGDRGGADQWLLWQQQWLTSPLSIRQLNIPYNTKACAVDADAGHLYVAEADRAIWRYNAEAEADESRQLWQVQQPFGALAGEISSLAILPDQTVLALQEEPAQLLHFSSLGQLQLQSALDGQHQLPTQPTLPEQSVQPTATWAIEQAEWLSVDPISTAVLNVAAPTVRVKLGTGAQSYQAILALSSRRDAAKNAAPAAKVPVTAAVTVAGATSGHHTASELPFYQLSASVETESFPLRGDVMDDPAIWHHGAEPSKSLILATDKRAGLKVYSVDGRLVQQLDVGRLNNIDLRYAMPWRNGRYAMAVATARDDNSLQLFAIAADGEVLNAGKIATDLRDIYGVCQYHSAIDQQQYVFVNDKSGVIKQYRIDVQHGQWTGQLVRQLRVQSQPEACVVDDARGLLWLGEEDVGVWQFAAEPNASVEGQLIATADGVNLVADVEGLALFQHHQRHYLLVSSQGNDSYVVYDVTDSGTTSSPAANLVLRFHIVTNVARAIDGSSETDGLDVTMRSLGDGFRQGAIVVQDGRNRMPEHGQNLKLVPLSALFPFLPK